MPSRTPLLSTEAVAAWLGVAPRTVRDWAEIGEIPALRVGKQWRFHEEDIRRWLEKTRRDGNFQKYFSKYT
jgi:excisionase family DNA binding protein